MSEADLAAPAPASLRVRPMQSADLPQVVALDQASFSLPWPAKAFAFELNENPGSLLFVAETQPAPAQLVGMAVIWLIVDEAHIATIAVDAAYRGHGVGRALMCAGLAGAMRRGMTIGTLEVRAGNLAAQQLYRRLGFAVVGTRKRYYKDNHEDGLIMTVSGLNQRYLDWLDAGAPGEPPAGSHAGEMHNEA